MSLTFSPGYVINDPEFAPRGSTWFRGITPLRLTIFGVVCVLIAARPALWNFDLDRFGAAMGSWLRISSMYFIGALPMLVFVVKAELRTAHSRPAVRIATLVAAVVAGAVIFDAFVQGVLQIRGIVPGVEFNWPLHLAFFFRALALGGLFTTVLFFAAREREAERRLHASRLSQAEIARQLVESRLQLLQAQIEPHFLFNSLASVKRLYERDPGEGRELLGNLRDYLRVATSRARQREMSLGEEIALARSFLAIFKVRMGRRLRVRIDVPEALERALVPPLMVATLLENAIKHGIAPRASGGFVGISAVRRDGVLEIVVADDGVGFRSRSGPGVGLANIRARLGTLFAGAGSLDLEAAASGGVTATLRIPFRSAVTAGVFT